MSINAVAPLAGAWIEIFLFYFYYIIAQSLPSRERGLKLLNGWKLLIFIIVAPLAGAWIEIQRYRYRKKWRFVAPLAGAWIEIVVSATALWNGLSLPSRERGLKCEKGYAELW